MIKYFLIFIFFIITQLSYAQCPSGNVTFENQAQVDYFLEAYPSCTEINGNLVIGGSANGPITNINSLENITYIDGNIIIDHNIWMFTLLGLNNLEEVGGNIYIDDCAINDISALSNLHTIGGNLELRRARFSDLSYLGNITSLGGSFYYSNENLSSGTSVINLNVNEIHGDFTIDYFFSGSGDINLIGNMPITNVDGNFFLSGSKLLNISVFDDLETVLGDFELEDLRLNSVNNFSNLEYVGGFFEIDNLYQLTSLDGFSSLSQIDGSIYLFNNNILDDLSVFSQIGNNLNENIRIQNHGELTNLNGFNNITQIDGEIVIIGNSNLFNISGIENIDPNTITNLEIEFNPILSFCNIENICSYLNEDYPNSISNNAPNCNSDEEVIYECNLIQFNLISGVVSVDLLSNDCTSGSTNAENIQVVSSDGINEYTTLTNSEGAYSIFVPIGNYTTSIIEDLAYYESSPLEYNSIFTSVGNQEEVNFCIAPISDINDLRIYIIPLDEARPGFDVRYKIIFRNVGTTTLDGTITLAYNGERLSFLDANPLEATETENLLSWDISDIGPFQTGNIFIDFNVLPPPTNDSGDILEFIGIINPIDGDEVPSDNVVSFDQVIINSFDPNDKTVLEGSEIFIDNVDDYLHYTIRFQNVGTASAINVRVLDQLSDQLDWSTLRVIDLSHDGQLQFTDGLMEFIFNDINLPAEVTDPEGSNGHITYEIKPVNGTGLGDVIENTAEIFFDFNAPIITNTAITTVVEPLGVDEFLLNSNIIIYPNPVSDFLNIDLDSSLLFEKVEIYSLLGKNVKTEYTTAVNLNNLTSGFYIIKVSTDKGTFISKVIKE